MWPTNFTTAGNDSSVTHTRSPTTQVFFTLGTVLERAPLVGYRIACHSKDMAVLPIVPREDWKKAQVLHKKGWGKLGFKIGEKFIYPSEKLFDDIPPEKSSIEEKRAHIKVWAQEFSGMMKNPKKYKKLIDGSWDFDVLMDMVFSFWVLSPIPEDHTKKEVLAEAGMVYSCNCPRFMHYHTCKHVLALGMYNKAVLPLLPTFSLHLCTTSHTPMGVCDCSSPHPLPSFAFLQVCVPIRFNKDTAGKRKAGPGASLSKRGKCLVIDA